jgi:hypothetical protein
VTGVRVEHHVEHHKGATLPGSHPGDRARAEM